MLDNGRYPETVFSLSPPLSLRIMRTLNYPPIQGVFSLQVFRMNFCTFLISPVRDSPQNHRMVITGYKLHNCSLRNICMLVAQWLVRATGIFR